MICSSRNSSYSIIDMYGRNGKKHPLTAEWSCSTDAADFRILANSLLKVQ
jgi:hypothetical protein